MEDCVDLGDVVFVIERPKDVPLNKGRNFVIVNANFMSKLHAFIAYVLSFGVGYDAQLAQGTKLGIALSELAAPWDYTCASPQFSRKRQRNVSSSSSLSVDRSPSSEFD